MPRGEDVFVRLETNFILGDPRFLRHSLTARAVFLHLSAVAVRERREFLQARHNSDLLAIGLRCTPEEARAGIEELIDADYEPLVGRLSDGRLRIIDVRKCHGAKFRWIDETEEFGIWDTEQAEVSEDSDTMLASYPRTGTNGDKRGRSGTNGDVRPHLSPNAPEVRGERLDVRGEISEHAVRLKANGVPGNTPVVTTTAYDLPTPDNVVAEDWRRLLAIARHWPVGGRDDGARRLGAILAANGPKDAETTARMIDGEWKAGRIDAPWGALGKSKYRPPDSGPSPPEKGRGGEVEALGDVLAKGD